MVLCLLCRERPATHKLPLSDGYGFTYVCDGCCDKLTKAAA